MVVDWRDPQAVDRVFGALADATRRDIVARVCREPLSVTRLAADYAMSFAAVQKHVAVLHRAGLVTKTRSGREQLVTGRIDTIRSTAGLLAWYEAIWRERLDRIEEILINDPHQDDPEGNPS